MDFIVFSDDWGEHPSSCQHLFRQIAREHRVLWVNTVGMRSPRFSRADLDKAARKVHRMLKSPTPSYANLRNAPLPNLEVLQPPMLPLPGLRPARAFNDWSARRAVQAALLRRGMRDPVVVTTVPNACDVVARLGASRIVYYCVDDFAQWPGINHRIVRAMEQRLVDHADLLLATSETLRESLARSGKPTQLFEHGVDLETFGASPGPAHPRLAGLPHPRAGFFGLLDERLDGELLAAIAQQLPQWTFVLAGPRAAPIPSIQGRSNIVHLGPLPYQELPMFVAGIDVLILPYRVNEFTQTISPLKLNEYIATGKSVVSAPLREVAKREQYIRIALDSRDWEQALGDALKGDVNSRRHEAAAALANSSWRARAATMIDLIRSTTVCA